jgi:nicotinamidase-related amidase
MAEVSVATRGGELLLDVERTAVVVVDMQNDFVSVGGMFDQNGVPTAAVVGCIGLLGPRLRARMWPLTRGG